MQAALPKGGLGDDFSCVVLHWPHRAVYELDAAALHTKYPRENLLGRRCFHMLAARAFRQAQPGILGGQVRRNAEEGWYARATLRPSWRSETERR